MGDVTSLETKRPTTKPEMNSVASKFSVWDLIPFRIRVAVAILFVVVVTAAGAVIANVREIWRSPERLNNIETTVGQLVTDSKTQGDDIKKILRALLLEPSSVPTTQPGKGL